MRKNQKLGLVAITFLAAGFGTWFVKSYSPPAAQASPVMLQNQLTQEERREKQKTMVFEEVPDDKKVLEHALEDRWGHLEDDVLTAAAIDLTGDTVYYDKKIVVGLSGNGKPIFGQISHSLSPVQGIKLQKQEHFKYSPAKFTNKGKKPGSGFLAKVLKDGRRIDRSKAPEAWKGHE